MDLKVFGTFNTAGLARMDKRVKVDEMLFDRGLHCCLLQESNLTSFPVQLKRGKILGTLPGTPHAGLAIWISNHSIIRVIEIEDVVKDRVQRIKLDIGEGELITLYNIHLPHKDKDVLNVLHEWVHLLKGLGVEVPSLSETYGADRKEVQDNLNNLDMLQNIPPGKQEHEREEVIIAGDFNLIMDIPKMGDKMVKKNGSIRLLHTICKALKVQHISMTCETNGVKATRGQSVIDYICLPKAWNLNVKTFEVISTELSDHALLQVEILFDKEHKHRAPYWRFKNDLLMDDTFLQEMTQFLKKKETDIPNNQAIHPWWNDLKSQIIQLSKNIWFKKCRTQGSTFQDNVNQTKLKWTRYKRPQKIYFLKNKTGTLKDGKMEIMKIIEEFYGELYTSKRCQEVQEDMTFGLLKILDQDKKELDIPITLQELEQALMQLNLAKAPGIDGITVEFYAKFWSILGPMLLVWIQQTLELGKLTGTSALGVVTLIFKKEDARNLGNWRPITLMTVDVKILSRTLASRLRPIFNKIIPITQTCLPGRTIHSSLGLIRDVLYLQKTKKQQLFILSIDQNKAFDRINHDFLFKLLNIINLPPYIIAAIKTIYTGYCCIVRNGSHLSQPIQYQRGIRQGDPMSTLLYALALQPALNAITLTIPREGYLLSNGKRLLATAYADDVTCFLQSYQSITYVIQAFEMLGNYSEAKVNLDKSLIAAFNLTVDQKLELQQYNQTIPIQYDSVQILGINFSASTKIDPKQWEYKIQDTKDRIGEAKQSLIKQSYADRAKWCSNRIWPRWLYLLKVLQPSSSQIQQLAVLLAKAIWLGGKHWLDVHDIAVDRTKGGLSLIHPCQKIEAIRVSGTVKMIQMGLNSPQFFLAEEILSKYANAGLGFKVLHSHPDQQALLDLPPYYQAILMAWDKLSTTYCSVSLDDILNMPCFDSKFLQQQEPPVNITVTQAKSMKTFTIRQVMNIMYKETRFYSKIKYGVSKAVSEWMQNQDKDILEESICVRDGATIHQEDIVPLFAILVEDRVVMMENWSNKLIMNKLKTNVNLKQNHNVAVQTWKTLEKQEVPNTFKNQFWRFLHKKATSSAYYYSIGVNPLPVCLLCHGEDLSYDHQFLNCPSLSKLLHSITEDVATLGLPKLQNQKELHPGTSCESRIANFILIAFIYTVILIVRSIANGDNRIGSKKVRDIYYNICAKHIVYYARENPPSNKDSRFKWLVLTHNNILARIKNDVLEIRAANGFRKYSEKTFNLL